jgi:hypothetical protein
MRNMLSRPFLRFLSYIPLAVATHALAPRQTSGQVQPDAIHEALAAFDRTCASPAARIWGPPLCGPIVLVDPGSRQAFANRMDPTGVFVRRDGAFEGLLPVGVPIANTSFKWMEQRWAGVMLPLPTERYDRLALLAHEAFHRLQDSLGWTRRDVSAAHLATRQARLWWRLELRALEQALTTDGAAAREHVRAALQFRRRRQTAFPGSDSLENTLEYYEGLAEYTGQRVALSRSALGVLKTVDHMRRIERSPSLVRGFAYATGPALGLLLDRWMPGWHRRVHGATSLAALLAQAVGARSAVDSLAVSTLASDYGYARIAGEEETREQVALNALAAYRSTLVAGPVLRLEQPGLQRSFDPNSLVPFDTLGTVYPTGTFSADWGTLEVTGGGALVSRDFRLVTVPLPSPPGTAREVRGPGWTLRLAEGWAVRPGSRGGDFLVVRSP